MRALQRKAMYAVGSLMLSCLYILTFDVNIPYESVLCFSYKSSY
jgi:hypothetical protein